MLKLRSALCKNLLLILPLFLSLGALAQSHHVGLKGSFGLGVSLKNNARFGGNLSDNHDQSLGGGLEYIYQNKPKHLRLSIGLTYLKRDFDFGNYRYLRAPIGFDFIYGKKLYGILGAGGFLSRLNNQNSSQSDIQAIDDLILGLYFNAGLGYELNERLSAEISYRAFRDLGDSFFTEWSYFTGGPSTRNYYPLREHSLNLRLIYRLGKTAS